MKDSDDDAQNFGEGLLPQLHIPLEPVQVLLSDLPPDDELISPPPDSGMVKSADAVGVFSPVILERVAEGPYPFKVVAGKRRIKTARILHYDTIAAMIYEENYVQTSLISLMENQHRSHNFLADLENLETLMDLGLSVDQIISITAMNKASVMKVLSLQNLLPPLRKALMYNQMEQSTAMLACKLDHEKQRELVQVLEDEDRIKCAHVHKLTRVVVQNKVEALPSSLFSLIPEMALDQPQRNTVPVDEIVTAIAKLQNGASGPTQKALEQLLKVLNIEKP